MKEDIVSKPATPSQRKKRERPLNQEIENHNTSPPEKRRKTRSMTSVAKKIDVVEITSSEEESEDEDDETYEPFPSTSSSSTSSSSSSSSTSTSVSSTSLSRTLSEYEVQRLERIAANQKFMESLGVKESMSAIRGAPSQRRIIKKRTHNTPARRSSRLEGKEVDYTVTDNTDYRLLDGELYVTKKMKKSRMLSKTGGGGGGRRQSALASLTPEERATLDRASEWLGSFERFLKRRGDSDANRRQVLNQTTKLVSGFGIQHPRSQKNGCVFRKGIPLHLDDDVEEILKEAWEWEAVHGEDLGHGWLVRHPLKKIILFQRYTFDLRKSGKKEEDIKEEEDEEGEDGS